MDSTYQLIKSIIIILMALAAPGSLAAQNSKESVTVSGHITDKA